MTEEEIEKIKEHIEIHARREPTAIKITEIMRRAVKELEFLKEIRKHNNIYNRIIEDPKRFVELMEIKMR